jgi:hypothetical protein
MIELFSHFFRKFVIYYYSHIHYPILTLDYLLNLAPFVVAYCNPGEKIQWYTVSWPSDSLSWEDFRGKVLGATDPSEAPKGSIRRDM